jgi:tetratricopeptide (TPR) repeat protein
MLRRKHASGFCLPLGIAMAVFCASPPAQADAAAQNQPYPTCTKQVSPADSEAAHSKYIAGKVDYDEGNYDQALKRFREAYALDCSKHELLIIISAAWEKKQDLKEAIRGLETYLERAQGISEAEKNTYRAKIDNLKKDLAKKEPAATPPAAQEGQSAPPVERRGHTPYPWIVVGAGAAAVAVGVVLVATAPSLPFKCNPDGKTCEQLPGERPDELKDRQDRAGASQVQPLAGWIVVGGGAALVAGGLLWHFLEPTGPKDSGKTKLHPLVASDQAGLAVTGRF